LIWGTAWSAIRLCIQPGAYAPIQAAALRFTGTAIISALLWVIWNRFSREKFVLTKSMIWLTFWASFLNGIAYSLLYIAETEISGGLAAVIATTETFFVGLVLLLSRHDKVSRAFWAGTIISIVGMAIVFHNRMQVSVEQTWAMALTLVVSFSFAAATVVLKEPSKVIPPIPMLFFFSTFCAATLWAFALVKGLQPLPTNPPLEAIYAMLWLTISAGVGAFLLFFVAMKLLGVQKVSTLVLLIPVISLITDHFIEKRVHLDAETYIGIAVVLVGVAVCFLPTKDREIAHQPAEDIVIHE